MTTLLATIVLASIVQDEPCLCKPMPTFNLKATDGLTYTQKSLAKKNTVVVFLSHGCPHNPKAAVDLNKLKKILGDKVGLIGMVNADQETAKEYAKELKLTFPLISDQKASVMKKFGASHSLDLALICSDDQMIGKSWKGYSQGIFQELFAELPKHGGPKFDADLSSFPKARQSGCGF